jgi:hypothetical protein
MTKYIVIKVDDDNRCPECGWDIEGHHPNCPIGRLEYTVVEKLESVASGASQ